MAHHPVPIEAKVRVIMQIVVSLGSFALVEFLGFGGSSD